MKDEDDDCATEPLLVLLVKADLCFPGLQLF